MDRFRLNRNQIKYIIVFAMVLDHLANIYFPLTTIYGQIFHFIGRMVGPIMAYFIVEGYIHTSNLTRYVIRMGIFALVSWVPFSLYETGCVFTLHLGVIYTLFLGLISIVVWDTRKIPYQAKPILLTALVVLSSIGDWRYFGVLIPMLLYIFRANKRDQLVVYYLLCLGATVTQWMSIGSVEMGVYNIGIMMAPLLVQLLYNGQGGNKSAFNKWFFYVFYPSHLLVLAVIKYYI